MDSMQMTDIVVKVSLPNGVMRRRRVDAANVTLAQIREIANQDDGKLTWQDEDNDTIVIETESDLQESLRNAQEKNLPLRLSVQAAQASQSERMESPAPVPGAWLALLHWGRQRIIVATQSVRSKLSKSPALKALIDDSGAIKSVFHARVERNPSAVPILSFCSRLFLLWTLLCPSWLALTIVGFGVLLLPKNAVSHYSMKHIYLLLGLISLRVVFSCIMRVLCGVFACVLPAALGLVMLGFLGAVCKKMKKRRLQRRQNLRQSKRRCAQRMSRGREKEAKAIRILREMFPTTDVQQLLRVYHRRGDVAQTAMELSSKSD